MTRGKIVETVEPARFAWANAVRVEDDHKIEVERISAEAYLAVKRKRASLRGAERED